MEKFVALIGAGYWGKNLLRNLYELGALHSVCEVNPHLVAQHRKKYPNVYYTSSYEEVLENPDIKAVAIATPAATHFDKVKQALLANKDVYVEKPLALKVSEREEGYFVHPSSFVDEQVSIGGGTKIWHFSHILPHTKIGQNCIIAQNCMIGPDVKIGNQCKIQNNVSIYKGVELEDGVFCGPSCVFTNVLTPRAFIERKNEFKNTLVKQGATIGANATVVCGHTIGKYAMIGAGAVVASDVEDYALYTGVPAKKAGWVCKCGVVLVHKDEIKGNIIKNENNKREILCPNCKSIYILEDNTFYPLEEKI